MSSALVLPLPLPYRILRPGDSASDRLTDVLNFVEHSLSEMELNQADSTIASASPRTGHLGSQILNNGSLVESLRLIVHSGHGFNAFNTSSILTLKPISISVPAYCHDQKLFGFFLFQVVGGDAQLVFPNVQPRTREFLVGGWRHGQKAWRGSSRPAIRACRCLSDFSG